MTTKATLGVVDPDILDRANHTGEQAISTVSGLQGELDDLQPITGTWSPTLTGINNVGASGSGGNHFFRIGNIIHCFGWVEITPNASGNTATRLDMSLPVASSLLDSGDLRGVMTTQASQRSGAVYADTANNLARFDFSSEASSSVTFSYQFSYVVQ